MKRFVYCPITPYHIILSSMLREYNKDYHNSIILDESTFAASFINKISENNNWDNVYVLKKYHRLQNYVYKNILYKLKYGEIFQLRHINLVFFSFGNDFTNLLINSIHENNNMLMGEDGILPYYGLDIIKEYRHLLLYAPKVNKFKKLVKQIVNPNIQFNSQRIDKFLILNPEWLQQEVIQQYEIEHVKLDRKIIRDVFDELTYLYNYNKSKNIFNDIDIIFFDSEGSLIGANTEQEEFYVLCNIFNRLRGMRIFIKLKPLRNDIINNQRIKFYNALQKKTSCNMVIDSFGSEYPWEVVFYNNADALKDVIFMSIGFSTAFLAPKKFFDSENDIICLKKLFSRKRTNMSSTASIGDLIERIKKTYLFKKIYMPETFDEIKDIIRK